MQDLASFKKEFDKKLKIYLDSKIKKFTEKAEDEQVADILNYTQKLVLTGGKHIRPYMALIMYETLGGQEREKTIETLVCLELFHVFCLIHDDVMDNGTKRHGIETLNLYIANKFGTAEEYGKSQAILIGDLLFSWSQEIAQQGRDVLRSFYQMVEDTVLGQMIDVRLTTPKNTTTEQIMKKMLFKTARYTFVYPLLIGAGLAGPKKEFENFCQTFGEALGIAFQVQDDLLDLEGKSEKTAFSDIREGQHTLFTQYIFDQGSDAQKETLTKYFGKKFQKEDEILLQKLFADSGAIGNGKKIITDNLKKAKKIVAAEFKEPYQTKFMDIIAFVEKRRK